MTCLNMPDKCYFYKVKNLLSNSENKIKTEDQRRKEKAIKEEQKRTYGAILQLKQRQRAEVSKQ